MLIVKLMSTLTFIRITVIYKFVHEVIACAVVKVVWTNFMPPFSFRKQKFFYVYRGYKKRPLAWNGLITWTSYCKLQANFYFQFFCDGLLKMVLLTLSWRRSLPYRNQFIDLFCKSMDWFLYDIDLCYERA